MLTRHEMEIAVHLAAHHRRLLNSDLWLPRLSVLMLGSALRELATGRLTHGYHGESGIVLYTGGARVTMTPADDAAWAWRVSVRQADAPADTAQEHECSEPGEVARLLSPILRPAQGQEVDHA